MVLLLVAVLSIPVMLLVKPFILRYRASHGMHVASHGHGDDGGEVIGEKFVKKRLYSSLIFSSISATPWSIKRFIRSNLHSAAFRIPHPICDYGHFLSLMLV
jgi:hypothetical protein